MTELLITPDQGALKPQAVALLAMLLLFTMANYLANGYNATTQALLLLAVVLAAYHFCKRHIAAKQRIRN